MFGPYLVIIFPICLLLKWPSLNGISANKMLSICCQLSVNIDFFVPFARIVLNVSVFYQFTGFSNTIMRFVSGWITKIPHMTPMLVNNIGLLITGVALLLVPLCSTYRLLIIYCIAWGGFVGECNHKVHTHKNLYFSIRS
jgi:hypothetical protein